MSFKVPFAASCRAGSLAALLMMAPGSFGWAETIDYDNGLLSVDIDKAPLGQTLAKIARRLDAELFVRGELGELDTVAFKNIPVETALRRLVAPHGLLLRLGPPGNRGDRQIAEIRVYQQITPEKRTAVPQNLKQAAAAASGQDSADNVARIRELMSQGDAAAMAELTQLAMNNPSNNVRRLSVTALARIGSEQSAGVIEQVMTDVDPTVRLQAARALAFLLGQDARPNLEAMATVEDNETIRSALDRLIDGL